MSRRSEAVKAWRANTKRRIIESMGGKCALCGYDKCSDALECHHLDPNEKDFGLGRARANPNSWPRIVTELRKCVLVCSNCHREVHAGLRKIPKRVARFDDRYADYKALEKADRLEPCPVCGSPKDRGLITCSLRCAGKRRGKVDWDALDLPLLLETMTFAAVAEQLGVSDAAVHKRYRKLQRQ